MIRRTGFVDIYKKWLIFLIALFLFAPNTVLFINKIIFLIAVSLLFYVLFTLKDISLPLKKISYQTNVKHFYILIIIQFFLVEYISRYYTGSSSIDSLLNLMSGQSNYDKYQEHFEVNELSSLSVSKVPAILANALVKGVFLLSIASFVLTKERKKKQYLLFFSAVPCLLFAISRGTFFEVFEVFLCVIYFYKLMDSNVHKKITTKKFKNTLKVVSLSVILLFLFVLNAGQRYGDTDTLYKATCATKDFCFEPYSGLLSLEYPIYFLSTYFSAGFFFFTEYVRLLLEGELLNSLIPFASNSFFQADNYGLFKIICVDYIDCGSSWRAEIFSWISTFGFLIFLFIFPLLFGCFFKIEKHLLLRLNIYSLPLCYLILLYIISIPVGSFYTVSSSNIICSVVFLFLWASNKKY